MTDEEIDAFLLKPLSDPLDDAAGWPVSPTAPPPSQPAPPSPPTRPATYPPKRLYRDPNGKIAGVASGLAHYFNIDVAIIRLILILLTLSFLPIPIYIAAWIAIPKAATWPPPGPPQRSITGRLDSRMLTAAAILVGLIVIASADGSGPGAIIVPVILIAVGVYLLNQPSRNAQTEVAAEGLDAASVDPNLIAAANQSPYEPALASPVPAWAYESTAPAAVAAPPRRRRRTWLLLLIPLFPLALVAAGGAIVLSSAQDTTVTLGETRFAPQSVAAIQTSYRHSFGSTTIDFTAVDFTGEAVAVDIKNAFGETIVIVPDDVFVTTDVDNSLGEVDLFGDTTEISGFYERVPEGPRGKLDLTVDNSFGEVKVTTD